MKFYSSALVGAHRGDIKQHESTFGHVRRRCDGLYCRRNRDQSGLGHRIPVRACRDRGKSQRSQTVFVGKTYRLPVAARQSPGFAMLAAAIDWTDRVNDVLGAEPTAAGNDRLSGGQPSNLVHDLPALGENGWSSGVMNRTIDSAPAHKR